MPELTPEQIKIGQKLKYFYEKGKALLAAKQEEEQNTPPEQPIS